MKTTFWLTLIGSAVISVSAQAQETFIFDQQSSTNEGQLAGGVRFQDNQPFGESFVPSLSSIGFVRLFTEAFFAVWRGTTHQDGSHYTLQEAVDEAMKGRSWIFSKPVIYGCPDLKFYP